jgi:hypothetical protein
LQLKRFSNISGVLPVTGTLQARKGANRMTDPLLHIGNISKPSEEWLKVVEEAKVTRDPWEYLAHIAYAIVNEQVKRGVSWNKCMNCGSPYVISLDVDGRGGTFCSGQCEQDASEDF